MGPVLGMSESSSVPAVSFPKSTTACSGLRSPAASAAFWLSSLKVLTVHGPWSRNATLKNAGFAGSGRRYASCCTSHRPAAAPIRTERRRGSKAVYGTSMCSWRRRRSVVTRGFPGAPTMSPEQPWAVTKTSPGIATPAPCGTSRAAPPPSATVAATASGSSIELKVMRIAVADASGSIRTSTMSAALPA